MLAGSNGFGANLLGGNGRGNWFSSGGIGFGADWYGVNSGVNCLGSDNLGGNNLEAFVESVSNMAPLYIKVTTVKRGPACKMIHILSSTVGKWLGSI
jgi:hypothetical protein